MYLKDLTTNILTMKNLNIILILLISFSAFSQKKDDVEKVKKLFGSETYSVDNEAFLKFNYQDHTNENTYYKMKFFQNLGGVEFWGHHKLDADHNEKYLTLFIPDLKLHLKGSLISDFYDVVMNNYKTYQKEVRIKKPNVHLDVNLDDKGDFIFSSHMIGTKSNYAFWINKKKFQFDEKDFLKLMAEIRIFYNFKEL